MMAPNYRESKALEFLGYVAVVAAFLPLIALWNYCRRHLLKIGPPISYFDECKYLFWKVFKYP